VSGTGANGNAKKLIRSDDAAAH